MMCEFLLRHGRGRRGLLMLHDFWRRILFQLSESTHICTLPNTTLQNWHFWENILFHLPIVSVSDPSKKSLNLKRYRGESNINRVIVNRSVYCTGIWGAGSPCFASFSVSAQYLPQITGPVTRCFHSFVLRPTMQPTHHPRCSLTHDLTGAFTLSSEVGSHKWFSRNKMNASHLNFH